MLKRIIAITVVIIVLAVPAWYFYMTLKATNQIKLLLPQKTESKIENFISISVDESDQFYVNDIPTAFNLIDVRIDSFASLGYNDSVLSLIADPRATVQLPNNGYSK
jgi:biopolymer transport protein ExbD